MAGELGAVLRRGRWRLPVIGASALVGTGVTLALPAVLGRAVDAVVAGHNVAGNAVAGNAVAGNGVAGADVAGHGTAGRAAAGWIAAAGLLVAAALVADLVDAVVVTACVADAAAWLRRRLVAHVLAIGPRGAGRFATGDLIGRISGNVADAARAGPAVVTVAAAVTPPVGALVLLALIDLAVAGALLAGLVLAALVLRAFTRRTAAAVGAYLAVQGRIAARLAESLSGARTIAAAGTVERERRRVLEPLPELSREGARAWRELSRSGAQAAVVGPLVLVAVLAAGGYALAAGRITPGELFAAGQYAALGAGLGGLTGVFGRLARARAGLRRAGEVLAVPPVPYGPRDLPPGPGRLEFRGVAVTGRLERLDLVVPGGACLAVVGRSGSGKSLLAALAARLCDPDAGVVLLDGVPVSELDHDALRCAVGCAFERPVLIGGTVADAIGLGLGADPVRAAARATRAHEFVVRLPAGYDTPLGRAPLSGGEAQRLGLARAWPADRLLVLDDATSSLDVVTEMSVERALADGRTRLVVTHRAATAARADLVAWLDGGRLRGVGRHDDLWARAQYRELFR